MKFDKIVAFGDSFVWGDELLDPALAKHPEAHSVMVENTIYRESHCFLGCLGSYYNVPTENFGWPGGSLQSTIWIYLWWIEHETVPLDRVLVLIGLTDSNRTSFYNPNHVSYANDPPWNRFMHSNWIHSEASTVGADWIDMGKRYMMLTDCEELMRLNFLQALLFFAGQDKRHAGLLQFKTICSDLVVNDPTLLWPNSGLQGFFDDQINRQDFLCPMGHPNERGHQKIAELLIPEIDRVTMFE